jgi:hypothetical protein
MNKFLNIIKVACICICILVIGIIGWNYAIKPVLENEYNKYFTNAIEIDKNELEKYFLENQIHCEMIKELSVLGTQNYRCKKENAIENVDINIIYNESMNKPLSIAVGIKGPIVIAPQSESGIIINTVLGIPYKGSKPDEARNWFWDNIKNNNTKSYQISTNISNATYTVLMLSDEMALSISGTK